MGGMFECIISSVKRSLRKALREAREFFRKNVITHYGSFNTL